MYKPFIYIFEMNLSGEKHILNENRINKRENI